jgi:uncharacterized surface protein with fasciclin (FAS1) repeats
MARWLRRAGVLALSSLWLAGCSDDDDDGGGFQVTTIGESLGGLGLTTLDTAVQAAELDDDLAGPGPFTLFAPENDAFDLLPPGALTALLDPANQAQLIELLTYHALAGSVDAATAATLPGATTLQGDPVVLETVAGELYVNDARVVMPDVMADNGIIHVVDRVLQPPTDIVTTLVDRGFTQLVASLQATGLAATLMGPGPFTLHAPTDDAFAAVAGALGGLSTAEVTAILQYHVLPGAFTATQALAAGAVPSATGTVVVFSTDAQGQPLVNAVTLSGFNIPSTNGIVHVVDEVLVDPLDIPALAGALGLDTLVAALVAAGLDDDLAEPNGPFTVFAPTEAAFAALPAGTLAFLLDPANQAALIDVLTYHVLAGEQDGAALGAESTVTTLQGDELLVDTVGSTLYLNDAAVLAADLQAENGLVHAVDAVLTPPASLVDTLVARGFTTLVQAVTDAGLAPALSGPGPFTVLAPTDAAFAALPAGFLAGLTMQELADVLEYHVISGSVKASAAVALGAATTLEGTTVAFELDGDVPRVNGVTISAFNIPATNGVVHVIDAVLLAPDLPALAANLGLDTLVAALAAADLDDDLAEPNGPFTVFAPSEAAFAAVPPQDLAALLDPANVAALEQLLLYHVVPGALDSADVLAAAALTTLEGSDLAVGTMPPTVGGASLVALDRAATNGFVHVVDAVLVPPGFVFPLGAGRGASAVAAPEGAVPGEAGAGLDTADIDVVAGWSDVPRAAADPLVPDLVRGDSAGLRLVVARDSVRIDVPASAPPGRIALRVTGTALDGFALELVALHGGLPVALAPSGIARGGDGALLATWILPRGLGGELDVVLRRHSRTSTVGSVQLALGSAR